MGKRVESTTMASPQEMESGARLAALRKAAGFTQSELTASIASEDRAPCQAAQSPRAATRDHTPKIDFTSRLNASPSWGNSLSNAVRSLEKLSTNETPISSATDASPDWSPCSRRVKIFVTEALFAKFVVLVTTNLAISAMKTCGRRRSKSAMCRRCASASSGTSSISWLMNATAWSMSFPSQGIQEVVLDGLSGKTVIV